LNRLRELQIEKDLLVAESKRQLSKNDTDATQVCHEIDNLRAEFARLKFEKETLIGQIEVQKRREQEFGEVVEKL
jgi:aspartyl/asparaginyl beta-hydroxylase (cupin superfamily)